MNKHRSVVATVTAFACVATLTLSGCGGGSGGSGANLGAADRTAVCADWSHVSALDDSDASGSSIAFYTQMRDLYQKVEKEGPSSIKPDLKVLVADEQQLVNTGSDSPSANNAAQSASYHVDDALTPVCKGK